MPKAAGGWRITATSGCFNAGCGRPGPPSAPVSPTRAGAGFPYVGGKKATLLHLFREKGVVLTAEGQARFDALPEQFMDFVETPARFAAQWAEAA